MKYIDENRINSLLTNTEKMGLKLDEILAKSRELKRLSLEETAFLFSCDDKADIEKILKTAEFVKNTIYGKRVVMFAPLYASNICVNNCKYCSFRTDNKSIERKALTVDEIKQQVLWLLKRGHKRILLVAGEAGAHGKKPIDFYIDCIEAIYSVVDGNNRIKRVNINCAPLTVDEFKRLKNAGIGTFQIFQETYHNETYKNMHPSGPKSDADNRISAVDNAFEGGIDDIGMGVLYGLYDYKFETLALLMHIEALEKIHGVGPHTISVPRLEPAFGVDFSKDKYHFLKDEEFEKLVAILRLAVPYTGIILSTRESAEMRDKLLNLGVSQVSAESATAPGGYGENNDNTQFCISDNRTLDEMIESIIKSGSIPSFCAACYRSNRTGKAFMEIAKPGNIKGKCQINGLITLKEYLDDFASEEVKEKGNKLIAAEIEKLSAEDRKLVDDFFKEIKAGKRDKFV